MRRVRGEHSGKVPVAVTPRMMPLVWQATAAVGTAVLGAVGLYVFLTWLLGLPLRPIGAQLEQQRQLADLVKVALGLAAGVGAAVALIVGYRRARVEEAASHRDDQRLFSSRYQDAADLLGHDKAAVRLAGIYAMARLADDWIEQRQQSIDVLCAYLRLPYDPKTAEPGEREVRLTVIRLISEHLQADAAPQSWRGRRLDFTGAVFDGGDFTGAIFDRGEGNLSGSVPTRVDDPQVAVPLEERSGAVSFAGAEFRGDVTFRGVRFGAIISFAGAIFSSGATRFHGAQFEGRVSFNEAMFVGATVDFRAASFLPESTVSFFGANFTSGIIQFGAKFKGGRVSFSSAKFSGSMVNFGTGMGIRILAVPGATAEFDGGEVSFRAAEFSSGIVSFAGATFGARFSSLFHGILKPDPAEMRVTFENSRFAGGTVIFDGAQFNGIGVDLQTAQVVGDGVPPVLPVDASGLLLPESWNVREPSSPAPNGEAR